MSSFCICKSYSHFFSKNTCELDIVLNRTVNILTTNELIKVTMLWTTGPWLCEYVNTRFVISIGIDRPEETVFGQTYVSQYIDSVSLSHMTQIRCHTNQTFYNHQQVVKSVVCSFSCCHYKAMFCDCSSSWTSFILLFHHKNIPI